ncbi:LysR substrate-binding domain-containing protein [Pectobacterium sp. S5]|uniref:LysR substrate-binding domain-containing protein n=1 Tax=Pectobacterium TaxID=122277 RepID=UPI003D9BB649
MKTSKALSRRDRDAHNATYAVSSAEGWTFTTFEAATQAVLHQVAYGWLPDARISEHIMRGELQVLPLQQRGKRTTPLYLLAEEKGQPLSKEILTLIALLFGRL